MPPTGKSSNSDYVHLMEFEDGKISHMTKILERRLGHEEARLDQVTRPLGPPRSRDVTGRGSATCSPVRPGIAR